MLIFVAIRKGINTTPGTSVLSVDKLFLADLSKAIACRAVVGDVLKNEAIKMLILFLGFHL